jgi:hypothetical protein
LGILHWWLVELLRVSGDDDGDDDDDDDGGVCAQ